MAQLSNTPRYGWPTLLVVLGCVVGTAVSSYLLFVDYWHSDQSHSGPRVGEVRLVESQVRLRPRASFLWDPVIPGQAIYQNDTLESGPESSASIQLKNGTTLELGENSLVVINDLSELSLKFLKGNFIVRGEHEAKKVTIDSKGIRHEEKLPVDLEGPENGHWSFLHEEATVKLAFKWQWQSGIAPIPCSLQVSSSRSFRKEVTHEYPVPTSGTNALALELWTGRYYWRIVHDAQVLSEERALFVAKAPLPIGIRPFGKIAIWGDGSSVPFHWTVAGVRPWELGTIGRIPHELEVASDAAFTKIVARKNVEFRGGRVEVGHLKPGSYHWRIKGSYPSFTVVGEPLSFEVVKEKQQVVQLVLPAADALVPAQPLRFTWDLDSPPAGAEYEIQLFNPSPSQKATPVESHRGNGFRFEWAKPRPGLYRWRVLGYAGGQSFASSDWRSLAVFEGPPIALLRPKPDESLTYWETPEPPKFLWRADPHVKSAREHYELDVATDRDFKSQVKTEATDTAEATGPKLDPGSYYWRVRAVDGSGHSAKLSETRAFTYRQHAPLGPPASAIPADHFVFKKANRSSSPELTWAEVPDAIAYEVTVRRNGGALTKKRLTTTGLIMKNAAVGRYSWTVRALDRLHRPGMPLPTRELTVDYGDPLAPPQIVTSEVK